MVLRKCMSNVEKLWENAILAHKTENKSIQILRSKTIAPKTLGWKKANWSVDIILWWCSFTLNDDLTYKKRYKNDKNNETINLFKERKIVIAFDMGMTNTETSKFSAKFHLNVCMVWWQCHFSYLLNSWGGAITITYLHVKLCVTES